MGRPEDADAELATLTRLAGSDSELVRATVNRATFLAWVLTRPGDGEAILDDAAERVTAAEERLPLVGLRAMMDGQLGRPAEAEQAALKVFDAGEPTADSVLMACCGMVAALAITGRADRIAHYAAQGADAGYPSSRCR